MFCRSTVVAFCESCDGDNLQYSYPPSHDEAKTRSDSQPSADLKGLREYRNDRAIPCAAHIPACPSISGKPAPRARHLAPAPTLLHGVLGVFELSGQLRVAMLLLSLKPSALLFKQAQAVEHHQQADAHVCKDCHPHRRLTR